MPRVQERTAGGSAGGPGWGAAFVSAAERRAEIRRRMARSQGAAAVFGATGDMQEALLAQVEGAEGQQAAAGGSEEPPEGAGLALGSRGHGELLMGPSIDAIAV